jgi:nucleoside-diphosphate-sugar epimerase
MKYPYDSLANCLRWNLMAVLALFEQARQAGIERFVVAGSCFEYGRSSERYASIPTNASLEPTNSYAASKAAASIAILQWAEEHRLNLELLRIFHVFGEGELETRFWPSLRKSALMGIDYPMTYGEQIRDFIPVEDVAKIFLKRSHAIDHNPNKPTIYNIGSGNPVSLISFAQDWWRTWNAKGEIIPGAIAYRTGEVMRYAPGQNLLTLASS